MSAATTEYKRFLSNARRRPSRVGNRTLEEEADSDRGRVLFCPPFRRLQDKAQVFSLETNAAVRSRLTHSLEVSSIGRFVAQRAINAFTADERKALGIEGSERALITFVETACLLHDIGNPPFGHFGEIAISNWFIENESVLTPKPIGVAALRVWNERYADFRSFDGNPQGLRISTRLQPSEMNDLTGLNLTATTIAATIKYPWSARTLHDKRKKPGFYQTEEAVIEWVRGVFDLPRDARHPLVYLMEAADDIAYCLSDIEDGIERGLVEPRSFARYVKARVEALSLTSDAHDVVAALDEVADAITRPMPPAPKRLAFMQDLRSSVIRLFAGRAGESFKKRHAEILAGTAGPLLGDDEGASVLSVLKEFAHEVLYRSKIVRSREVTAHAVIFGLLDAYRPLMACSETRFEAAVVGDRHDGDGKLMARESGLIARLPPKYLAVYRDSLQQATERGFLSGGEREVAERILRMRVIVDHISGMTDAHALRSLRLMTGVEVDHL